MKRLYIAVVSALLLLSCSDKGNRVVGTLSDVAFIAHAGGSIGGLAMTNSMEALYAARDKGYKYIELDLQFTSDSVLVAMHDWAEYNMAVGQEERGDSAPSFAELSSRGLPNGFTLLTHSDIYDFFIANDSICFVTDKISNPDILDNFFPGLESRMLVEAFSYKDYVALHERGYRYVTYSCMAEDVATASLKHILFSALFPGQRIDKLALHTSAFDYIYMKLLLTLFDFEISLFTINRIDEIPEVAFAGLKYIYTDALY